MSQVFMNCEDMLWAFHIIWRPKVSQMATLPERQTDEVALIMNSSLSNMYYFNLLSFWGADSIKLQPAT